MIKDRDYSFDNLRFYLILLVVVGHLLEIVNTEGDFSNILKSALYFWIYSVHMPAFIFLSGFFAKFDFHKIVKFIVLYLIFQVAYVLFSVYVLGSPSAIQFVTPYWILWYILVLVYYYFLIPVLNFLHTKKILVISATIVLSLAAGYIQSIGYPYSLSRFLVFLPFFVVGYYVGRNKSGTREYVVVNKWPFITAGVGGTILTAWLFLRGITSANFFYGSLPYSEDNQIMVRILQLIIAASNIGLLLVIFLIKGNRRIHGITHIGQSTISVYLLHGFIVKYLDSVALDMPLICVPFYAAAILLLTGNQFVSKLFQVMQEQFPPNLLKVRNPE